MKDIDFMGWEIKLKDIESMVEMCKATGVRSLAFGVACKEREDIKEFINPEGGEYAYGEYKLFVRGSTIKPAGLLLAFPLVPKVTYFDEFPPIPPEPITEEP